jgi:hypothetical protein
MGNRKLIIDAWQNPVYKGTYRKVYPKEFENAIILDCEESKTTIDDVKKLINQAIDEKRPLIVESIDLLLM